MWSFFVCVLCFESAQGGMTHQILLERLSVAQAVHDHQMFRLDILPGPARCSSSGWKAGWLAFQYMGAPFGRRKMPRLEYSPLKASVKRTRCHNSNLPNSAPGNSFKSKHLNFPKGIIPRHSHHTGNSFNIKCFTFAHGHYIINF